MYLKPVVDRFPLLFLWKVCNTIFEISFIMHLFLGLVHIFPFLLSSFPVLLFCKLLFKFIFYAMTKDDLKTHESTQNK